MYRTIVRTVIALATAAAIATTATPAEGITVGPIRKLGTGAWCWFTEPRALQIGELTVTGWVGTDGSVIVASYDETTGQVRTYNLHPKLNYDDHANQSLYLRRDGRITAFYSSHAGRNLYYRTSVRGGGDITAWEPERTLGTNTTGPYGYTYSNPLWSPGEGKLYLFWRGASFLPAYSTSGNEGGIWAPARTLMLDNDAAIMRPYVKYTSRNGVMHMAYNQAHPRDRVTSVFYLRYTPGAGWQRVGGALAGGDGVPPFQPQDGDRVWNAWSYYSGDERSWVHDIAVGADGKPVIVFSTFRKSQNYQKHWYWYARWTGTRWLTKRLTYAGPPISGAPEVQYSAGISLDQENPSIVYLSRKPPEWGVFKVQVWVTPDYGTTWQTPVLVERGIRPVSPRRDPSTTVVRLLYLQGHYGSYTTFTTEVRITGLD